MHGSHPDDAATLLVGLLEAVGVEHVFGVPGGAIEPLTDALAVSARRGGPRLVVARHETGAAFMAEGHARQTGGLGVCCATSGPGATNLITGVASAYENGVPVLAITGQPALPLFGRRALQESSCTGVDVVAMLAHCTRTSTLVSHADQVEPKATAAILRALRPPLGPVHLSIPVDILRAPAPRQVDPPAFAALTRPRDPFDPEDVELLHAALRASRRPVFVLGRGCAGAVAPVLAVAESLQAPFVVTPDAKGLVGTAHPLYRGVLGFAGHTSATAALAPEVDTVLLVGSGVSEWTSAAWNPVLLSARLVHVAADPEQLLHSPMARLHVHGSIGAIFTALAGRVALDPRAVRRPSRIAEPPATDVPQDAGDDGIAPPMLLAELSAGLPAGTRFVADAGNSTAWAIHHLEAPGAGAMGFGSRLPRAPWLHVLTEFAPMGWAIGAAVGLARAAPDAPVVCLTGDGSYLMSGQEITVAAQEELPVVFVVLNDGALGMVKHGQRLAGAERTAFALPDVDYGALAAALGVPSHVVRTAEDLRALDLHAIAARPGPTLLDVRIDGEQTPPMRLRLRTLNRA